MKDILFECGDRYVECDIDGLKITYTFSEEPKYHYVETLRDEGAYDRLKRDMYAYAHGENPKFDTAWYFLATDVSRRYFAGEHGHLYRDLRDRDEIYAYHNEAGDKVWLMRTRQCDGPEIERILNAYDDIPVNGYTDWECGYWNGILGALRWVLGEEKDMLDT